MWYESNKMSGREYPNGEKTEESYGIHESRKCSAVSKRRL